MAENTLQFRWIVTIKEGVDRVYRHRPDVFVAGDLFWYPVQGHPDIVQAPDVLVAIGRPKGDRGSYMQWVEDGIAPQVVFEVLSPSNRPKAMTEKLKFYEKHDVQEYYIYDPDYVKLNGYQRAGGQLQMIPRMDGWVSPRLGIRFDMSGSELTIHGPDGRRFLTFQEIAEENDQLTRRNEELTRRSDQAAQERDQAAQERDAERQRAERMAAQLRALGIEPPA